MYCIHAAYTYGADGSAAIAGSQPSPLAGDDKIVSPAQPVVAPIAPVVVTTARDNATAEITAPRRIDRERDEPAGALTVFPFPSGGRTVGRPTDRVKFAMPMEQRGGRYRAEQPARRAQGTSLGDRVSLPPEPRRHPPAEPSSSTDRSAFGCAPPLRQRCQR